MSITWHYGDVAQHASTIGNSTANLEAVHKAILADVQACAEFWQSQGQGVFDQFVNDLNRNFAVIAESLGNHGTSVNSTLDTTQYHDHGVGQSWSV